MYAVFVIADAHRVPQNIEKTKGNHSKSIKVGQNMSKASSIDQNSSNGVESDLVIAVKRYLPIYVHLFLRIGNIKYIAVSAYLLACLLLAC